MTKKARPRIPIDTVLKSPTDKVLDSFAGNNNTASSQNISTGVQPDILRKLTFQIRDTIYRRLIDRHYLLGKQLGHAPDREVIVEEAIATLLDRLDDEEDVGKSMGEAIAHRQRIREQDLESGALVNPSSRKRK